jgi:RNA polymerase sigma factor (sigma-70 family)
MRMDSLARALRDSIAEADRFEEVFNAQFDPLVRRMMGQVYDSEIAVDIAAETLAEAFIQRRRFRGQTDSELIGWLNGIANRKVAMFYRKHAVEKRALAKLGIDSPSLTEEEHREVLRRADLPQMRQVVLEALAALSEPQRTALTMRVVQEMPYEAMARELGITEEAVRARVARALAALRKQLQDKRPLLEGM